MRTIHRLCLVVALTALVSPPLAAQFGRGRGAGMRAPEMRGVLTPTEGAGAVYQSSSGEIEMALVGREDVGGKQGYWIQIGVTSREGQMYLKQLRVMEGNTATIAKVIMQPPKGAPMEMPARMFGPTTSTDASAGTLIGKETITVPAGTFECDHYQAADKSWDSWVSARVPPFGVVKSKDATGEMTLVRTVTGVVDRVRGTPQRLELPDGIPGVFGR